MAPPAEVNLHLVNRGALRPPERQGVALGDPAHEALHRAVGTGEAVVAHQGLVDPLGVQADCTAAVIGSAYGAHRLRGPGESP